MMSIMFDIKNKMNPYLLATVKDLCFGMMTHNSEFFIFIDLLELRCNSILPLGIAILLIKSHGLFISAWDFIPILELRCVIEGIEVFLVHHTSELLLKPGNTLELLPAWQI
jgi:hypothetical protein